MPSASSPGWGEARRQGSSATGTRNSPNTIKGASSRSTGPSGRSFFARSSPMGTTYRTTLEVFLEPKGNSGFAPTDAVVAPDGALLISIGGRKTPRARSIASRMWEEGRARRAQGSNVCAGGDPRGPPTARCLVAGSLGTRGEDAGEGAVPGGDPRRSPRQRGQGAAPSRSSPTSSRGCRRRRPGPAESPPSDAVRAAVAWSCGRLPCPGSPALLERLALDADPRVRLRARIARRPSPGHRGRSTATRIHRGEPDTRPSPTRVSGRPRRISPRDCRV